jgi:hypothetical protein
VSSVLNGNSREYGKSHLFDGNSETCWNSESGSGQYIQLNFSSPVVVKEFKIQFQGGFVGKIVELHAQIVNTNNTDAAVTNTSEVDEGKKKKKNKQPFYHITNFEPKDDNSDQSFVIPLINISTEANDETKKEAAAAAAAAVSSISDSSFHSHLPYSSMKLVFPSSTDFFGRITIYKLDILGQLVKS